MKGDDVNTILDGQTEMEHRWALRMFVLFLKRVCNNFFIPNSDKKRKMDGGNATTSNGAPPHGKLKKKETQHGKFKKNKDKHGKFGKKPWTALHWWDNVSFDIFEILLLKYSFNFF